MTDQQVTELKEKNPGRDIVQLSSKSGEVAFKVPNAVEIDAFRQRLAGNRANAAEANKALVATCCVYPSKEELRALLDRKPFLLEKWAEALMDAAGADEEIELKKL